MNLCPYCGAPMSDPRRRQCGSHDCFMAWNHERNARYKASGPLSQDFVCATCGDVFTRPPVRGQRPRYCPEHAAGRGWKRDNPGSRRRSDALRRSRVAAAERETFDPIEIFERDGWRCQVPVCRQRSRQIRSDRSWPHPLSPSVDHIIPVIEGGGHVRANVRASHLICNTSRGARGGGDQLLLIG